jgi:hypothetical protein
VEVAALFVQKNGCYFGLDHVQPWDIERDAKNYNGPYPVVAHPPCQLWGRFAKINYMRWGGQHNRPGNDGNCFLSALVSVETFGGVLEHPAYTNAWEVYHLDRPKAAGWMRSRKGWVCEVWQSTYGHLARKATWLYYCGDRAPFDLKWDRVPGSHQIGFHDQRGKERNKPTLSGKKASATPILFRDELINLAIHAKSTA